MSVFGETNPKRMGQPLHRSRSTLCVKDYESKLVNLMFMVHIVPKLKYHNECDVQSNAYALPPLLQRLEYHGIPALQLSNPKISTRCH